MVRLIYRLLGLKWCDHQCVVVTRTKVYEYQWDRMHLYENILMQCSHCGKMKKYKY